ncbi:hypothetical protein BH10BAC2_BH10BAC2_39790 [soil metagenome]
MTNAIQIPATFQTIPIDGSGKKVGFALIGMVELKKSQLLPAFEHCVFAKPTALVGDDIREMKKLAAKYNIPENSVYSYENFDAIKYNKAVDAVYIVLPNSLHKTFAIRAAKAGKHVLCEKPMSVNVKDAEVMIDVCRKKNRKLMVAYRIHYEPHHQLMRNWVQKEIFGKVKMLETFNGEYIDDASQWRFKKDLAGGGVLMDLGIYCINTMRFLKGNEPV